MKFMVFFFLLFIRLSQFLFFLELMLNFESIYNFIIKLIKKNFIKTIKLLNLLKFVTHIAR